MEYYLKQSVISLQLETIEDYTENLLQMFSSFSLKENDSITEKTFFLHGNQNPDSLEQLKLVLNRSNPPTVKNFIQNFQSIIIEKYKEILKAQLEIDQFKMKKNDLRDPLEDLEKPDAEDNIMIDDDESFAEIYYYQSRNFQSEIFNHYNIRYKGGVGQEGPFQKIQSEKELFKKKKYKKKGTLKLDLTDIQDTKNLYFQILGKKIQTDTIEEEDAVNELALVQVPLLEIFMNIDPQTLTKSSVPKQFLEISYVDISKNAPYKGENFVGFCLNLSLEIKQRYYIAFTCNEYYKEKIEHNLEIKENNKVFIENLLSPFQDVVEYNEEIGLKFKPDQDKRSCVKQNCIIF